MNNNESRKKQKKKKNIIPVLRSKDGQNVAKVTNNLLIPLAIIELCIACGTCALSYFLRYDIQTREDCSMVNWEGVQLTCNMTSDFKHRPIYNESDITTTAITFELPESVFFTCAIVVPMGLVILIEVIKVLFPSKEVKIVKTGKLSLLPVLRRIPRYISTFMMGGAVVGILVSVLKLLIASPRPHFLAVCSPNSNMTDDCSDSNYLWWSPSRGCDGSEAEVHEALRSFPSYHASLAAYCVIWITVYLSSVAQISGIYNAILILIGAVMVMGSVGMTHQLAIGVSSSNDVIVGGIMGAIAALYVTLIILNGFQEKKFKVEIVGKRPLPRDDNHPNILPIRPLNGPMQEPLDVSFEDDVDLVEDNDFESFGYDNNSFNYISMIPRAGHRNLPKPIPMSQPTPQAVNSNVHNKNPANIPKPPPLPSYGPPPSYTRTEPGTPYNVPRQRFSAPVRTPEAPAYSHQRVASNDVVNAYHSRDSDQLPRARTETASYF